MSNYQLGILGCGNMGGAILKAIIQNNIIKSKEVIIYDLDSEVTKNFSESLGVDVAKNENELFGNSMNILFAIKPQILPEILEKLSKDNNIKEKLKKPDILVISIAAGIPISTFEKYLGKEIAIARIMPNILALVNGAASGISVSKKVNKNQIEFVKEIFNNIGSSVSIDEKLMDAVTGLSGSGPAFVAIMIEAMADAGVKMGIPRKTSYILAAQTFKGTADLILEKDMIPAQIKDMVSSPGGTTITGLHELERNGLRNAIISAVEAATKRSLDLKKS